MALRSFLDVEAYSTKKKSKRTKGGPLTSKQIEYYFTRDNIEEFDERYADADARIAARVATHRKFVKHVLRHADTCKEMREAKEGGYVVTKETYKHMVWSIIELANADLDTAIKGISYWADYPRTKNLDRIKEVMGLVKRSYETTAPGTRVSKYEEKVTEDFGPRNVTADSDNKVDRLIIKYGLEDMSIYEHLREFDGTIDIALWDAIFFEIGSFLVANHLPLSGRDEFVPHNIVYKLSFKASPGEGINQFRVESRLFKKHVIHRFHRDDEWYDKAIRRYKRSLHE